jgi:hypothetical protein
VQCVGDGQAGRQRGLGRPDGVERVLAGGHVPENGFGAVAGDGKPIARERPEPHFCIVPKLEAKPCLSVRRG